MRAFWSRGYYLHTFFLVVVLLVSRGWGWAAVLENPQPGSFQSGIGVISGWVCEANRVEIQFDDGPLFPAAYGTSRADTRGVCGDDGNNGFGLLFNWNILGDGVHTVRALADGREFARATFLVTTLGQGEFVRGLSGTTLVINFPQPGATTQLRWQESLQNFVIAGSSTGGGGIDTIDGRRFRLENPQPGSFQSGIGVISGWVCEANRVEIQFDDGPLFPAAYGTSRADTRGVCGDDGNNGFGLLFNWNILGDGVHRVRAFADGMMFADVSFVVTTLGRGEFARGLTSATQIANFPQAGTVTRLQWQESQQNFSLSGAIPAGVSATQCGTQAAPATDGSGATASLSWSNPCLLSAGQAMLLTINNALSGGITAGLRAQTAPRPFFACDTDLRFLQGGQVFDATAFDWLDAFGGRVCRTIAPGDFLQTFIRLRKGARLNFTNPFQAQYAGRQVIAFPAPEPCQLGVSATELDFGAVSLGGERGAAVLVRNNGSGTLRGQAAIAAGSQHFQLLSPGSFTLLEGQSQQIGVGFRPTTAGDHGGSIAIESNCGSALVRLFGQGVLPRPPQLAASPDRLDFGQIPRGRSSTRDVVVTNVGGGILEGELTLILEQGTSGPPVRFSLEPGQSRTISVTITIGPNDRGGPFSGTVEISSNGGSKKIPVVGTII